MNKFDVSPYPSARRYDMVFDEDLNPGEAFVFIKDHDPKPLYYQMEAENDQPFKWEYVMITYWGFQTMIAGDREETNQTV